MEGEAPAPVPKTQLNRFRDLIMGDSSDDDDKRFLVKFFDEKSFKERLQFYFIKNPKSALRIQLTIFLLKILTCILYVVRVYVEDHGIACYDFNSREWPQCNETNFTGIKFYDTKDEFLKEQHINWWFILWVERNIYIYVSEVILASISLSHACLMIYLNYKGNILQQLLTWYFILEVSNSFPFVVTVFVPGLRSLFIPVFLNLWLAKDIVEDMFNDAHRVISRRQSLMSQQVTVLVANIITVFLSCSCGIQHLQRGGFQQLSMFDSLWLVVVTLATVGYGDVVPDIWPSKLYMMIMICVALTVLPKQLEKLMSTYSEMKRRGGSYGHYRARREKHVVLCATHLSTDIIMDFLHEFYAHPQLQDYYVVLLSPSEMDETLEAILQIPLWEQRVIFVRGSALRDMDLSRCRMSRASACFILASRSLDRKASDEHTILRSWAIRDHSPHVKQYIQIFLPESKLHISFSNQVVCEDELKYALLAYNCICPGTSTLVTLLLHTSRGKEGNMAQEEWQKLYGKCSGNEIYEVKLHDSQFFSGYCGKSFSYATCNAYKKYGVCLIGVLPDGQDCTVKLNPGPYHVLKKSDTLFYLSITDEEHSSLRQPISEASGIREKIVPESNNQSLPKTKGRFLVSRTKETKESKKLGSSRPSISYLKIPLQQFTKKNLAVLNAVNHPQPSSPVDEEEPAEPDIVIGVPPVAPYIGKGFHQCYVLKTPIPICCLNMSRPCTHTKHTHVKEYNWTNLAVIIATDNPSKGLYNFILPLRSHRLKQSELRPIVLFLSQEPDRHFKEMMCQFPQVYWIQGTINKLEDWLNAGINYTDNVVIVNRDPVNVEEDEYLSDSTTIMAVQTLFRLFPSANVITELSQSSNMRFMQFRANDKYALSLAKLEKKVRQMGSNMSYMFRLPFSAGQVFSASMLDTLLCQAFVKDYLITIIRLLLGIDQGQDCGHLSCTELKNFEAPAQTYGQLYESMCFTTGSIPMGIYRTQETQTREVPGPIDVSHQEYLHTINERSEIANMVQGCMRSQGIPSDKYSHNVGFTPKHRDVAFVIINPPFDTQLQSDDLIFTLMHSTRGQLRKPREFVTKSCSEFPATLEDVDETGPLLSSDMTNNNYSDTL